MTEMMRAIQGKKVVGIWDLVCWAFQRECASIDFVEQRFGQSAAPKAWDTIAKMMEQNKLGCRVDGGGSSDPHHDAEIVAGALAVLPEGLGGRQAALWVADLARAGRVPDYSARLRISPAAYQENQHGRRPAVVPSHVLGSDGWPKSYRVNRKGRTVEERIVCTPVAISPTAEEVARMRRSYTQWRLILLELKTHLQISHLTSFCVSDVLPPRCPWQKEG